MFLSPPENLLLTQIFLSPYHLLQLTVYCCLYLVHLLRMDGHPQLHARLDGLVLRYLQCSNFEMMLRLKFLDPGVSLAELCLEEPDGLLELPGHGAGALRGGDGEVCGNRAGAPAELTGRGDTGGGGGHVRGRWCPVLVL